MATKKKSAPVSKKSQSKLSLPKGFNPLIAGLIALVIVIVGYFAFKSFAATPLWLPTADQPLKLGWILEGPVDASKSLQAKDLNGNPIAEADVYDIDGEYNTAATVAALHAKGKKVICYIDTGVYETYRKDAAKFQALKPQIWGNKDNGWDGSFWLDIRRVDELAPIMKARIQDCKDKGFDSIEPDEMVNYTNNPGFPLTYADQLKYNKAVASWAHAAGISIGLKDDHEQAHDLVSDFDWMLDEECWAYGECLTISDTGNGGPSGTFDSVIAFTKKNKAAWVAEYPDGDNGNGSDYPSNKIDKTQTSHLIKTLTDKICGDSKTNRINTAFYITGLPSNGGRTDCPPFPTRVPTSPSPTLSPSATVKPTLTPQPPLPTATATVTPTRTPSPSPLATNTPVPTVSPSTTPQPPRVNLGPPSNVRGELTFDWVQGKYVNKVSWNTAPGATGGYEVRRNAQVVGSGTPTQLSYLDYDLKPDVLNTYTILSKDTAGKSLAAPDYSATVRCFWIFCSLQ